MSANGVFLPLCQEESPWICWWRLLYFSPGELDQQDWHWKWFNWVHLVWNRSENPQKSTSRGKPRERGLICRGPAWGCTARRERRLDRTASSMGGHRVTTTIFNDRFLRTLQTKLFWASPQARTTLLSSLGQAGIEHFLCMYLQIHTHVHTSGCTGNKILISKTHYM